jgi:hypothetical protein
MVKVGDTVKWSAGKQGMLSGKVTGGEKGKRWRIESKGKRYYVPKEDVKKGVVKKEKAPAKKAEPVKKAPAKKVEPKNIVIRVKNYGRGINRSDVSDFRKLSQKEVFGAKSKPQPADLGNEYYLAEVSSQSDKDKLKQISEGYPSEVDFFSISSINKKFGLMGEKNISHSKIRSGDY